MGNGLKLIAMLAATNYMPPAHLGASSTPKPLKPFVADMNHMAMLCKYGFSHRLTDATQRQRFYISNIEVMLWRNAS